MRSSADLVCVYPPQVDEFWPHAEPLLKKATERCGSWSIGEVKREIDKGALLWIVWDGSLKAACVTRLVHDPRGLVLDVVACGGEGQDWRGLYEEIEDYGRNEGCVISRISGREGWKRIFRDYDVAWITLERRLDS
ncbi:hypothetical protein JQ628_11315 [Bradyrhizobium lablabi]|uniref:hypothetical protein n=1 Tax=Bradyrhizobium lablabi TaxID=722472 RepID=UPI001BAE440C|nr:hypothetical protein [Bradyrhizobium lablabi]MBR1122105.1 hypothetical protein [Bradyrhizobium lablabi]